MLKINIIGSIFGTTGYDSHTRSLFNALDKLADVKLSTQLIQNWNMLVNDAELRAITKAGREDDINVIVTTPHNWKTCLGLGINVGYCVWEGSNVPRSYIEEMLNDKIDLIFVPSEHTKQAIFNTSNGGATEMYLLENKIKVIPHGVDLSIFYPKEKPNDGKFRFICNKGWRGSSWDRGGVQYVIKAFAEEFRNNENVELLIKLNPAYINPETLNQAIMQLNLPENRAPIQVVLDNTPFNKLIDLYNKCDVYICATRAEAFNLPGLESMACGLPTIQTSFGGQTDYMTELNSSAIDYRLETVKEDIMYEGCQWAVPNIAHMKKIMRRMVDYKEDTKQMGKQALEDSKNWTWKKSAEKVIKCLEDISEKEVK